MQKRSMVISLIGRPNVGKSSLFNVLVGKHNKAMTYNKPGVTRDRHYGIMKVCDFHSDIERDAILVDTGGFYAEEIKENIPNQHDSKKVRDKKSTNYFFNIMTDHAKLAIKESDLVLLVVDVREGLMPIDEAIMKYIRKEQRSILLLVNKYDSEAQAGLDAEFYTLGISPKDIFLVSSAHKRGVDSLKTRIVQEILKFEKKDGGVPTLQKGVTPREDVVSKLAIVGAPNAGKSTLLNQLLGSKRALVSEIAGTTVDPIDGFFDLFFGEKVELLKKYHEDKKGSLDDVMVYEYQEFQKNNPDVYQRIQADYAGEGYLLSDEQAKDSTLLELQEEVDSFQDLDEEDVDRDDLDDSDDLLSEVLESKDTIDISDSLIDQVFGNDITKDEEELDQEHLPDDDELVRGSLWRSIHVIDTAGIRRQKQIDDKVEEEAVFRALKVISEADIVLYLVDAMKGISHQDRRLLDIACEKGKSIIICLNKIDLLKKKLKDRKEQKEWLLDMKELVPWLSYCELIPLSAKYGERVRKLKTAILKTILIRHQTITTGELNRAIIDLFDQHSIMIDQRKGTRLKFKYASMIKSDPPTVLIFSNRSLGVPQHYRNYLKNGIRQAFKLKNTPIHIIFRTGKELETRMRKLKLNQDNSR